MKNKIATLLLIGAVATCQAASINWQVGGANRALTDYTGSAAANTTVYLVLTDGLNNITGIDGSTTSKSDFDSALLAITVGTVDANGEGKKPASTTTTVDSDLLTAGQTYALSGLYFSTDATTGDIYYRVVNTSGTAYDKTVEGQTGSVSTNWGTMANASWTKGYTAAAVPEPSTAVLALAGLALLLKRRRA